MILNWGFPVVDHLTTGKLAVGTLAVLRFAVWPAGPYILVQEH